MGRFSRTPSIPHIIRVSTLGAVVSVPARLCTGRVQIMSFLPVSIPSPTGKRYLHDA